MDHREIYEDNLQVLAQKKFLNMQRQTGGRTYQFTKVEKACER